MKLLTITTQEVANEAAAEEIIRKARALGQEVLFEGSYEEVTELHSGEEIVVHWDEDDALPLFLLNENGEKVRELSAKEAGKLAELGAVTNVLINHPQARKYGLPISSGNLPELWKALCGNLGLKPWSEVELQTQDSGDDSVGNSQLTLTVPAAFAQEIEEKTQQVLTAAQEAYPTELPENFLRNLLGRYSGETTEYLKETLSEKRRTFQATGGRGVELADEIDGLEVIVAMRDALENETVPA